MLAVVVLAAVAACVALPMIWRTEHQARVSACAANLSALYRAQQEYGARFGQWDAPARPETGRAFWMALGRTSPPIIAPGDQHIWYCPVRDHFDRSTDYRGPVLPQRAWMSAWRVDNETGVGNQVTPARVNEVVAADREGNHGWGRGGNVLRLYGDVQTVGEEDPLWREAAVTTKH